MCVDVKTMVVTSHIME